MEWIDRVKRDLFKDICIIFRLFPADEERKLCRYCPLTAGPKIIVVKLSANPGMLEKNDCNDVVTELYLMGERASSQQYQNAIQYNLSIVALPKPKGTAYILAGTKLVQYMYLLAKVMGLFPHVGGVVHVDGLKKYVWETFIALSITSYQND